MMKTTYDTLSDKEKLIYDEMHAFALRLTERVEEQNELLKTLIAMVQEVDDTIERTPS